MPAVRKSPTLRDLPEKIQSLLRDAPSPSQAANYLQRLVEAAGAESIRRFSSAHLPKLLRLLGSSSYLSEILIRQGKSWPKFFLDQLVITPKTVAEHLKELEPLLKRVSSLDEVCAVLRRHKQREYLRIGTKDLEPSGTLEETVRELTALAGASLEAAYRYCRAEVEEDFGELLLPGKTDRNGFVCQ